MMSVSLAMITLAPRSHHHSFLSCPAVLSERRRYEEDRRRTRRRMVFLAAESINSFRAALLLQVRQQSVHHYGWRGVAGPAVLFLRSERMPTVRGDMPFLRAALPR